MNWTDLTTALQFWIYRVGGYLVLNILDEPAWLALMFCRCARHSFGVLR
jgi:hypothetical protein